MVARAVRIGLPWFKRGRVVRVTITLGGRRVRTVRGRSLRTVSYRFKRSQSGSRTLKLHLTVVRSGGRTEHPLLTRRYRLCKASRG